MQLVRLLDDIATDLEHQVGKIRDAATAASLVGENEKWLRRCVTSYKHIATDSG